jgi:GDP-mannose transporter
MADDKKSDDYKIDMPAGSDFRAPSPALRPAARQVSLTENPMLSILAYCGSSILMTTTNKYVLSGVDYNLNFFLLAVQVRSTACSKDCRSADQKIGYCLRGCHLDMQRRRNHQLPGL